MIRFLDLKGQIMEGEADFAFYDTVSNTILTFNDEQVFNSLESFTEAYNESGNSIKGTTRPLDRFLSLIPDDYFNQ